MHNPSLNRRFTSDLKRLVEQQITDLSRLTNPEEVKIRLRLKKRSMQIFDNAVRNRRYDISGASETRREITDEEVRRPLKEGIRSRIGTIMDSLEVLESRRVKYDIDISRMPPNMQNLFTEMAKERGIGKKLPKPKGRFRKLASRAGKAVVSGVKRIRRRLG